jgi:hypothetical protein
MTQLIFVASRCGSVKAQSSFLWVLFASRIGLCYTGPCLSSLQLGMITLRVVWWLGPILPYLTPPSSSVRDHIAVFKLRHLNDVPLMQQWLLTLSSWSLLRWLCWKNILLGPTFGSYSSRTALFTSLYHSPPIVSQPWVSFHPPGC